MLKIENVPKVQPEDVNLLIAIPCYGGMSHVHHNRGLRALSAALSERGCRHSIIDISSESLIPRARNAFAAICTFDTDQRGDQYTHLLFIDADIGFDPHNVTEMIGWDKDIVALPYACKAINWEYVVDAVRSGVTDPTMLSRMGMRPIINTNGKVVPFDVNEPVEFPQLGTGMLLIKRKVLEKFAEDPARKYKLMQGEQHTTRNWSVDFFQIGINPETRHYDSEDYRFCLDARKMGFETWLLPWAVTSHTGPYDFCIDLGAQAQYGIPRFNEPKRGFSPLTI